MSKIMRAAPRINTLLVNAAPEAVGYCEKMGWEACTWDKTELSGIAAGAKQMKKSPLANA